MTRTVRIAAHPEHTVETSPRFAVVGAGIGGLAAAFRLRTRGAAVTLFEAASRPGGVIRSERSEGFLLDFGPNTLVARRPEIEAVIGALGLERIYAPAEAARRYVVQGGRPVALPTSPLGLISTPLFSARAKLRLLGEPFARPSADGDESLAGFVRRRLGPEILDYAVDPFVAGVFAGDPERLAVRYAFPALWELERAHGSLARGMVKRMKAARAEGRQRPDTRPFSFRDGMQALPDALARRLGESLRLNTQVTGLRPYGDGWVVAWREDGQEHDARFEGVVLAVPLHCLPQLEVSVDLAPLVAVEYAPVSVLALGFQREDVGHPLDGFGVLVPRREPFRVLGALFSSTLFPDRAPEGHVLLTCFLGGARHPEDAALPTPQLLDLALGDLRRLLGVRGEPVLARHRFWPHAIPQYTPGYGRARAAMEAAEARYPRLAFAGSHRQGISVGEALVSGLEAAERVAR